MIYGVFNTLKGLLYFMGVRVDYCFMIYSETIEASKNVLRGVKAFLVLKLCLVCFFFAYIEPFMELDTLIVVDVSSVGNVRSHDDTNDGHEVLQRQGLS